MVRVPEYIALMSCLQVFFSAVLSGVRNVLVQVKGSTSWVAYTIIPYGALWAMAYLIQTWRTSISGVYF